MTLEKGNPAALAACGASETDQLGGSITSEVTKTSLVLQGFIDRLSFVHREATARLTPDEKGELSLWFLGFGIDLKEAAEAAHPEPDSSAPPTDKPGSMLPRTFDGGAA